MKCYNGWRSKNTCVLQILLSISKFKACIPSSYKNCTALHELWPCNFYSWNSNKVFFETLSSFIFMVRSRAKAALPMKRMLHVALKAIVLLHSHRSMKDGIQRQRTARIWHWHMMYMSELCKNRTRSWGAAFKRNSADKHTAHMLIAKHIWSSLLNVPLRNLNGGFSLKST